MWLTRVISLNVYHGVYCIYITQVVLKDLIWVWQNTNTCLNTMARLIYVLLYEKNSAIKPIHKYIPTR